MEQYLAGLTYRGSERPDGRQWVSFERPLTADDVLAFRDAGDTVVIVARDGRKHEVIKPMAPPDNPDMQPNVPDAPPDEGGEQPSGKTGGKKK